MDSVFELSEFEPRLYLNSECVRESSPHCCKIVTRNTGTKFSNFFLLQNIDNYNDSSPNDKFSWNEATSHGSSDNVMDRWIISFTQSLLLFVKKEMAAYRLYTVLPRLALHHFTTSLKMFVAMC